MDKRTFIKVSALAGAGAVLLPSVTFAGSDKEVKLFEQPKLGFAYNALEPYIDAQTMELHYSKHHAGYTKKFNAAIKANNITGFSLNEIFMKVSSLPDAVRNNGGGYYNHNVFWEILTPKQTTASGDLYDAINSAFGSKENFTEQFSKRAASVFGSGWTWLVKDKDNKLSIVTSANQNNTLMDDSKVKGTPILALDVWEHAYYLNYQNRRKEYINAFWNIVNWEKVSELFAG